MIEYHQSNLKHFFDCPFKVLLSMKHQLKPSMPQRDGLIMEAFVLGKKENTDMDELIGRKKKETILGFQSIAEKVKSYFIEGDSYVKLSHKFKEYTLAGEADFIGTILYEEKELRAIADLKFTGDIGVTWLHGKRSKQDFLQAVTYPYLWYKKTKELLPFCYIIVENDENTIIKTVLVEVTKEDFKWFENLLDYIHRAEKAPNIELNDEYGNNACVSNFGKRRCEYLSHCKFGLEHVGQSVRFNFNDLHDRVDWTEIINRKEAEQKLNELTGG